MSTNPEMEAWKQRALEVDILQAAQERGAQIKKTGSAEHTGPCPVCGGTDRFGVNTNKQMFICRGSAQGDVISLVQHIEGCGFMEAVESLTKEPPPYSSRQADPIDPEIERERREERKQLERDRQAKIDADNEASIAWARQLFEGGKPIQGTHAEAYLRNRGMHPTAVQLADFRFYPSLSYRGYVDENAKFEERLGEYPCMVAAIRNVNDEIIGIHRTFLDPAKPIKLVPPGWKKRNKAKKVGGLAKSGLIRLGPIGRAVAIGEGIETTLSFFELGEGPDDLTIAAGYSRGNLSGSSTGMIPHPKFPKRNIYNGQPNMDLPGMILPDHVEEVYLLGDGDPDVATNKAILLTAARRFKALGKQVFICMAPDGKDFNDVLLERGKL